MATLGNALGNDGVLKGSLGRVVGTSYFITKENGSVMVRINDGINFTNTLFHGDSGGAIVDNQDRVVGMILVGLVRPNCDKGSCSLSGGAGIPIHEALAGVKVSQTISD